MPRTPCVNFARYLGERAWVRRFSEANRLGAYLSVVVKGSIEAGDPIRIGSVPEHGVTAAQVYAGLDEARALALLDAAADGTTALTPQVRKAALKALRVPSPA